MMNGGRTDSRRFTRSAAPRRGQRNRQVGDEISIQYAQPWARAAFHIMKNSQWLAANQLMKTSMPGLVSTISPVPSITSGHVVQVAQRHQIFQVIELADGHHLCMSDHGESRNRWHPPHYGRRMVVCASQPWPPPRSRGDDSVLEEQAAWKEPPTAAKPFRTESSGVWIRASQRLARIPVEVLRQRHGQRDRATCRVRHHAHVPEHHGDRCVRRYPARPRPWRATELHDHIHRVRVENSQ